MAIQRRFAVSIGRTVVSYTSRTRFGMPEANRNECIRFDVWVREHSRVLPCEARGYSNRKSGAVGSRREAGDDFSVVNRQWNNSLVSDKHRGRNNRARWVRSE